MSQLVTIGSADNKFGVKLFVQSKNVKVFPCAYRGQQAQSELENMFDPESRSFTEFNYTNIFPKYRAGKESYVISWTPKTPGDDSSKSILKCIICGYYFEIYDLDPMEDFVINNGDGTVTVKKLAIALTDVILSNTEQDGERSSTILMSLGDTESFYLDAYDEDTGKYVFYGLGVVTGTPAGMITLEPFSATAEEDEKNPGTYIVTVSENWSQYRLFDVLDIGKGEYSLRTIGTVSAGSSFTSEANGAYSIALGKKNKADKDGSIALGDNTLADAENAVAIGAYTSAKYARSLAMGYNTETGTEDQIVLGKYNRVASDLAFILGWGNASTKKNIMTVSKTGDTYLAGTLETTGKIEAKGSGDNALVLGTAEASRWGTIKVYGKATDKVIFNLDDTGNIKLASTFDADGYARIGGTLTVGTKDLTTGSVATINGYTDIKGKVTIKGTITATGGGDNSLTLGDAATENYGSITVYGTTASPVFKVEKTGNTSIAGTLIASGKTTLRDALEVQKTSEFKGAVSITGTNSTLSVAQGISGKSLNINSKASIDDGGNISCTSTLTVKSTENVQLFKVNNDGTVAASGILTAAGFNFGTATIRDDSSNKILFNKMIGVNGKIAAKDDLYIGVGDTYAQSEAKAVITKDGAATFDGDLTAKADVSITGDTESTGDIHTTKSIQADTDLVVGGNTALTGWLSVGGTAEITGNTTITGTLSAGATTISGALTATGVVKGASFDTNSDIRLKQNIKDYSCSKSILDLPVKEYEYINDETHRKHIGCIAQDLQQICPELVHEGTDGYLTIEESKLVYLLIKEVKELKEELKTLKGE